MDSYSSLFNHIHIRHIKPQSYGTQAQTSRTATRTTSPCKHHQSRKQSRLKETTSRRRILSTRQEDGYDIQSLASSPKLFKASTPFKLSTFVQHPKRLVPSRELWRSRYRHRSHHVGLRVRGGVRPLPRPPLRWSFRGHTHLVTRH